MSSLKSALHLASLLTICFCARAFAVLPERHNQGTPPEPKKGLAGNDIGDIKWSGKDLWVGTDSGLSKLLGSGEGSLDWISYGSDQGIGKGSISALDAAGDVIWIATVFDTTTENGSFQVGDGLSASFDGGATWEHFDNSKIFGGFEDGPRTNVQNGAFGVAIDEDVGRVDGESATSHEVVWAAFFAGSLVRSKDRGETWERVLPDSRDKIDYSGSFEGNKHRTFSVLAYSDTVWVGTSSGMSKSTNGGETWAFFSSEADSAGNHLDGTISGNWVVVLSRQQIGGKTIIWAGTKRTLNPWERDGISFSSDGGLTWEVTQVDSAFETAAWNFAFSNSTVWATTDRGLVRSHDLGKSWDRVKVADSISREEVEGRFVGVERIGSVLWAGSENGLGRSLDSGGTWRILRTFVRTVSIDKGVVVDEAAEKEHIKTYAYPNPFSPSEDIIVRIQYSLSEPASVTIKIYDFVSRLVKVLVPAEDTEAEPKAGARNHNEKWDGTNEVGDVVANGVYFYRISTDRGDEAIGKIVVIK